MSKLFQLYILFTLSSLLLYAETKYPVDISYLVADFKYSKEHGIKICEVQQGALSALQGDICIHGGDGSISPMIADFFDQFSMKKWVSKLIYSPLKNSLVAREWDVSGSIKILIRDSDFLMRSGTSPDDPSSIHSYTGIVYNDFDIIRNFTFEKYPGILFVDAATLPYWRDKYKMSALFDLSDELKQYKAEWRLYLRKYDEQLSERIQEEMPSEFYVIKPRNQVLAVGVLVVSANDLDNVLQMILEPSISLDKHPDKKYSFWWRNKDDTFLIEKYYESDYLSFSHPVSERVSYGTEYHYDATMRLAFILKYDEGKMSYHCFGGFWKLPSKALEEEGTLNEKMISCCKMPFYVEVDPKILQEANAQMERAMILLYEKMLKNDNPDQK